LAPELRKIELAPLERETFAVRITQPRSLYIQRAVSARLACDGNLLEFAIYVNAVVAAAATPIL
jgi:hypothetical protein